MSINIKWVPISEEIAHDGWHAIGAHVTRDDSVTVSALVRDDDNAMYTVHDDGSISVLYAVNWGEIDLGDNE